MSVMLAGPKFRAEPTGALGAHQAREPSANHYIRILACLGESPLNILKAVGSASEAENGTQLEAKTSNIDHVLCCRVYA
jgi:hypothetical protein